jgi:hypothetical protein
MTDWELQYRGLKEEAQKQIHELTAQNEVLRERVKVIYGDSSVRPENYADAKNLLKACRDNAKLILNSTPPQSLAEIENRVVRKCVDALKKKLDGKCSLYQSFVEIAKEVSPSFIDKVL